MSERMMMAQCGNELRQVYVKRKKGRGRNMYLRVASDGSLHVSCPWGVKDDDIQRFIAEKQNWILKTEKKEANRRKAVLTGSDGLKATWLGKTYPVSYYAASQSSLFIEDDRIIFLLRKDSKEEVDRVFYREAVLTLQEIVSEERGKWDEKICRAHGIAYPRIRYRYMKSQWGNCKPERHEIVLSSRLIHFPKASIDYVLLHEYVHLLVPDHSARFYDIVSSYMPDYRQYSSYLK